MSATATAADLEAFRAEAREWLAAAEPPELPDVYQERFRALREWQRRLHGAGWVGIHWPERYGGRGLTMRHTLVFAEELTRSRLPQPVGSIGLEVVGPTILGHGGDELRDRLLPRLLSGEDLWCQGFSEPGAGSDLAGLRTRAVRDGDELVISGQKIWTSWATDADWCAVLARTDPEASRHHGISYVLVPLDLPGVRVAPIVQMTGDAEFNEIFFDEVRVPVDNVLAGFGDGWRLAMDTLGHERCGYAIRRRMENETAFFDLVAALRETDAGADLEPVHRRELGELFVELRAFEALSRVSGDRLARGEVPSPLDSIDKLTLTATEQRLYEVATDLLGPRLTVADAEVSGLRVEEWLKGLLYARSASVYGGSSQIQRTIVAERELGLPRSR
ncbi:MAG TPA: acyl-CoA dehydrogenase family protein [Solirubrobacterales bacterium]|nr:acyl-CoA dehydrogenase family protein [Solirubrobacterales bacterium]